MLFRSAARDSSTALAIFFETLHQWKALLQSSAPRRMPDQQIRGLVAELWFALNVLGENRPMAAVLLAWQGPYGAPQDFQTADGAMFEVKSVHSESTSIEISSADQLDPASGGPLTLSLVVVDEVPVGTPGSHTLVSLAAEFASRLQHNQYDLGELNHRLDALSLDLSDEHYGGRYYAVGQPRSFGVGEEFPRIVRANVPLAINRLTYRLRIAGFEAFEEKVEQSS